MEKIYLEEAVRQIKCICDQHDSDKKNLQPPFFFIIGAGVSSPSIKLASEIIEDCKMRVPDIKEPDPKEPINQYSFWIEKAFPSQESRRRYFTDLIANKPITHAHLRLAHLLSKKKVANIVITPNFDDQLERALWLFEKQHITCDHPRTIERIDPLRPDIQLIHVHGNYLFYDIKNLKSELEGREIVEKISSIMTQYSPIIIGYSGWEKDIIMTALSRTQNEACRNNIYWFCYNEEESESLPQFLKRNPYVKCVIPKIKQKKEILSYSVDSNSGDNLPFKNEESSDFFQISSLNANQVFDAFNTGFQCGVPELTEDPLGFFINTLRHAVPSLTVNSSQSVSGEQDLYAIKMVIERIQRAKECLDKQIQVSEANLNQVLDAVRKSDYLEAINLQVKLEPSILSEQQLDSFLDAIVNALSNIESLHLDDIMLIENIIGKFSSISNEKAQSAIILALVNEASTFQTHEKYTDETRICDQIIERFGESQNDFYKIYVAIAFLRKGLNVESLGRIEDGISMFNQVIERYWQSENPSLQIRVARSLLNKSSSLGNLGRIDEQILVLNQIVEKFGQSKNPELQIQVARSLFNKGICVGSLCRTEEEIAIYDQIIGKFGGFEKIEFQDAVSKSLFNKGICLGDLGRTEEEISTYDQVIKIFGQSKNVELQIQVAKSLFNKGIRLGSRGRIEEEFLILNQIIEMFDSSENPELQIRVAKAWLEKGICLGNLGRTEEEISTYDHVNNKYGQSENLEIQSVVVISLLNKGVCLGKLGRAEEEISIYNQVVDRFGQSENLELQITVAKSLVNKGICLGKLGRTEEELSTNDQVIDKFGQSKNLEIQSAVATSLVNKGVCLGNLGRIEEEISIYDQVMDRFGQSENYELQITIAKSLVNKGVCLGNLGRTEEEISIYDQVIDRFGQSENLDMQDVVSKAIFNKCIKSGNLDRTEEEISLEKSIESLNSDILILVLNVLNQKCSIFIENGDKETATAIYSQISKIFKKSKDKKIRSLLRKIKKIIT